MTLRRLLIAGLFAAALSAAPVASVIASAQPGIIRIRRSPSDRVAGLLCLPTLSTHGYEAIARQAMPDMATVIGEFLRLAV